VSVGSGFPLVGEPLALDLINTQAHTRAGEVDLLATSEMFQTWLSAQTGRLAPHRRPLTESDLVSIRSIRTHIAAAVDRVRHGKPPPARVLRALTVAQRTAPAYRELVWDGSAVIAVACRGGSDVEWLVAELAEAAVDLLTSPSVLTIRQCEGPNCRMLFLPAHPRRRWCSPTLCGNRVRVARHYQRRTA
jgi:predicted RNA-binding Zn ribbon-like protein